MYSSPNSSNTIPLFINGNNNNNHDQQISPYPNVVRPFSIESNPSSSSKEEQANNNNNNNNNCVCALSSLPPPPSSPFSFFQFPYSPLFEDNEILLNGEFHFLHHHQHQHQYQSLTRPDHHDQAGAVNMEGVSVTNAVKNNNNNNALIGKDMTDFTTATVAAATTTPAAKTTAAPTRRRSSKRDRHSKINTARGLRDRRMRLSLEVARRFFGLQDMLGFDKASKTVEWLLNQAKVEIKQLAREKKKNNHHHHHQSCSSEFNNGKSASSTSECEGVSSLDEVAISQSQLHEENKLLPPPPPPPSTRTRKRRGSNKASRKSAFNPIGKESREKARERARERTREKTRLKKLVHQESSKGSNNNNKQCNNDDNNVGLNRLSSWNPFENLEESAAGEEGTNTTTTTNNHNHNHSSNHHNQGLNEESSAHQANKDHHHHHQPCDYEEESLVTMSKWSQTMIFNPLINNSPILQEHHQFAEFHHQNMGKPWEAYNNEM